MDSARLKRNIGLVSATSIGLGAMLGAGIFVFPGLAGGKAGLLAVASFIIGGIIALAVAACTAELSTAMPNSGGGYFFISRSFGSFWGTLTGISQWIGLVFACAFYLVSFSEYAISFFEKLNVHWELPQSLIAFGFTLLLFVVNIIGTRRVGRFQNAMVISLAVILVLLFSYGLLNYFGFENSSSAFDNSSMTGLQRIFTTTALIFTSFLGFVQIANVGSEIKRPGKNLPKALIGSVLIALLLYIFIITTCLLTFPQEELRRFGETATIEVAEKLLGNWGAIIVVFAGLLAALSSANASMLSASRGVFALSKDSLISSSAKQVNDQFGTPHIALILVTLPVAVVLVKSNLEVFAEVASFLHLIIYAGICLSILKLRRTKPSWYLPTFKVPFVNILAGFGAFSCIALIFFMRQNSLIVGLAILTISAAYHLFFIRKRKIQLSPPIPPHIDREMIHPEILIPVDISHEMKELPHSLVKAIPVSKMLLLGFKQTPEQSELEQLKEKYSKQGEQMLSRIKSELNTADIRFNSELIFSNDLKTQFKEIIREKELRIILMLKSFNKVDEVIIPVYSSSQVNKKLITLIHNLNSDQSIKVKILLFVTESSQDDRKDSLKQDLNNRLSSIGIERITYELIPLKELSVETIYDRTIPRENVIIWSEAKTSERDFFVDIILDSDKQNKESPSIILLNCDTE